MGVLTPSERVERARLRVGEALKFLQTAVSPDGTRPHDDDSREAILEQLISVVASGLAGLFEAQQTDDASLARKSIRIGMATLGQALVLSQNIKGELPAVELASQQIVEAINDLKTLIPRTSSVPPPMTFASRESAELSQPRPTSVDLEVSLTTELTATSDSNFFIGFSGDIGDGGCFVATYDDRYPVGQPIQLTLRLPGNFVLDVTGVVQFVVDPQTTDDGDLKPGMGVQFLNLSTEQRNIIHRFIRKRAPMFFDGT